MSSFIPAWARFSASARIASSGRLRNFPRIRHRGVHVPEAGGTLVPGGGLDDRGDVLIAPHAHEAVGGGADLFDGILPPLGHAAGDHDLPQPALRLQLGQLFDLRQGLVPGLFEKAAGVHHGHVAVLGPQGHLMAGLVGLPDHLLAVDLVLGAAKGDKSYFHGIHPQNNTAGCSGPSNADYFCSLGQRRETPSAPRTNRAAVYSADLIIAHPPFLGNSFFLSREQAGPIGRQQDPYSGKKLFTIGGYSATISEVFRLGLPGRTASGWYSEEETVPASPAAPSRGPAEHRVAIGKTR